MVQSLSLTAIITLGVVVKWLLKWLPSIHRSARSKVLDQDATRMPPYQCGRIKGNQNFRITMGLRRLDEWNWLTVDKNYMKEHQIRHNLIRNERNNVLQCLPESQDACVEVLEVVASFLCERYPGMFQTKRYGQGTEIRNLKTEEAFVFDDAHDTMDALEIAARLTMEDLSVLMVNADGDYYLAASATLFPVGWSVQRRLGWTISQMHGPVPQWHEKIGHSVNKFLCRLTPESPMERCNYFLETTESGEHLGSVLFRPDGLTDHVPGPSLDDVLLRRERQTFRRLPRTGALLFGVKTTLTSLHELPLDEVQNLAVEVQSWPVDMARYKGRDIWGKKVLDFCNQRAGPQPGNCDVMI